VNWSDLQVLIAKRLRLTGVVDRLVDLDGAEIYLAEELEGGETYLINPTAADVMSLSQTAWEKALRDSETPISGTPGQVILRLALKSGHQLVLKAGDIPREAARLFCHQHGLEQAISDKMAVALSHASRRVVRDMVSGSPNKRGRNKPWKGIEAQEQAPSVVKEGRHLWRAQGMGPVPESPLQ